MKIKKASIFTKLIILAIIVYAVSSMVVIRGKIESARIHQAELEEQVAELSAENAEMEYAIEHSDDDDVIGDIARDKLGLVDQDEQVYYAG